MAQRSPREVREFLGWYEEHREAHPLPWDWSEDLSEIKAYAEGDTTNGYPELVFTKDAEAEAVKFEVDVGNPGSAQVFITDHTGGGLSEEELVELLFLFLGIRPRIDTTDHYLEEASLLETDPDTTPWGIEPDLYAEAETWSVTEYDKSWIYDFDLSPYPAPDGVCNRYLRE
jgi:hypothetical protein